MEKMSFCQLHIIVLSSNLVCLVLGFDMYPSNPNMMGTGHTGFRSQPTGYRAQPVNTNSHMSGYTGYRSYSQTTCPYGPCEVRLLKRVTVLDRKDCTLNRAIEVKLP